MTNNDLLRSVQAARAQLVKDGPVRTRPFEGDFDRVTVPARDCDVLRDTLIRENARVVVEIGLAYGSSALAIAEAILTADSDNACHIVIDPFQHDGYQSAGWEAMCAAGLELNTKLILEPSSSALPKLASTGLTADAAFVDGSHRFHEVFVDLYFLRKIVRPGGLLILDDVEWSSVGAAISYFEVNLGFRPIELPGRLGAWRLPDHVCEPNFTDFKPFIDSRNEVADRDQV